MPMSALVRPRFSRMIGISGAAAKVETTQVKKDIQERWKVRMCGFANEKRRMLFALCSESTGRSNLLATASSCSSGAAVEKANAGSRPVIPCSELPGAPTASMPDAIASAFDPAVELEQFGCCLLELGSCLCLRLRMSIVGVRIYSELGWGAWLTFWASRSLSSLASEKEKRKRKKD